MRRPIVIIVGFIVLVFAIIVILFGLKGPEMPIQEVHKVLSLSKFQQQATTPPIPAIPSASAPANTMQPAATPQQPIPAIPQPSAAPANVNGNNVGQPAVNVTPQGTQTTAPVPAIPQPVAASQGTQAIAPSAGTVTNNVGTAVQPQPQSTVPLIIPQQGNAAGQPAAANPQQAIPAMPQAVTAPGNSAQ